MTNQTKQVVTTETITPEKAREWLTRNRKPQRPIQQTTVMRYARMLRTGEWHLDGNTIKWDWDSTLIDGQHRLMAIIQADTPMTTMVARGLDPAVFAELDRGRLRSVGSVLQTFGVPNGTAVATALHALATEEAKALDGGWTLRLEPAEMCVLLERHPEIIDCVRKVRDGAAKLRCSVGVAAWIYYRCRAIDAAAAEAFIDEAFYGVGVERGGVTDRLRGRLIQNAGARAKLSRKDVASLIIRAWNTYHSGRESSYLRVSSRRATGQESFPAIA